MPWTWIVTLLVGVLLAVVARLFYRAFTGVTAARDRAMATLAEIWPHVRVEREPGLVVAKTDDDRLELDYTLVLKAGLDAPEPEARRRFLYAVLEAALVEQTDEEQLADEVEEASALLQRSGALLDAAEPSLTTEPHGRRPALMAREGDLLLTLHTGEIARALFGLDEDDRRERALLELIDEVRAAAQRSWDDVPEAAK